MDPQDQQIACLRMAIEMGCKPDAVIGKASELMNFVTSGALPSAPQGEARRRPHRRCGTPCRWRSRRLAHAQPGSTRLQPSRRRRSRTCRSSAAAEATPRRAASRPRAWQRSQIAPCIRGSSAACCSRLRCSSSRGTACRGSSPWMLPRRQHRGNGRRVCAGRCSWQHLPRRPRAEAATASGGHRRAGRGGAAPAPPRPRNAAPAASAPAPAAAAPTRARPRCASTG